MDLREGEPLARFRGEVRAFLASEWGEGERGAQPARPGYQALVGHELRRDQAARRFRRKAVERGYLYRRVPRRFGGSEQPDDPLREAIVAEEFHRARAPLEMVGQGPSMLVPTLLEHGTEAQKARFIRPTLEGELLWCQGYSEPGAGSDLASLRTRATEVEDGWLIEGRKIWTSNADEADWMFCLVRTERDAPRHRGISYLLVDMKSPGVEVRPLRILTGEPHFNEVFLDGVRVPRENLVGERGRGWTVSQATLRAERGLMGGAHLVRRTFDRLLSWAAAPDEDGRRPLGDSLVRERLASLEARLRAAELHGLRLLTRRRRGERPGRAELVTKLGSSVLGHDLARAALEVARARALLAPVEPAAGEAGAFVYAFLWSLGILIAGGASNVQRNVIAERGLGLPRDPRPRG